MAIMLKQPRGLARIKNLDLYFRDCVIGGPGAFMIPVREQHQFTEAIKIKVMREISAGRMTEGLVRPT